MSEHYFVVKATVTDEGEMSFCLDDDTLTEMFAGTVKNSEGWITPNYDHPDYETDVALLMELGNRIAK
jgi:hypothetical protein